MNKQYFFLAGIFLLLALGMLFLPDRAGPGELNPEELLVKSMDDYWYVRTDEVAERIINGDPTIQLIDVRPADQFETYAIPRAMNIPIKELLNPEWQEMLDVEGMNFVLYSNSNLLASQAWIICTRMGIENIFVMEGGMNYWVETILEPKAPPVTAPTEAIALYQFRRGASMYFGGGSEISTEVNSESLPLVKKKKRTVTSGGC